MSKTVKERGRKNTTYEQDREVREKGRKEHESPHVQRSRAMCTEKSC